MTEHETHDVTGPTGATPAQLPLRTLLQIPGVVAIAFYLVLLAFVIVFGVVNGAHYPRGFLILSALLFAASGGLMLLFRWAWALALGAVFLLFIYNLWIFATLHQPAALIQGLLNMIFFFYLVRPQVREKLR